MTAYRVVRLVIHPGKSSTAWILMLRDVRGREHLDRRLQAGTIDHVGVLEGHTDVTRVLRHIADEVDRRTQGLPRRRRPGAPGGDGGESSDHRPGRVCAYGCPLCGEHLDGMPSDD